MFEHVNDQPVFERMRTIRDRLSELEAEGRSISTLTAEEKHALGAMFGGDMILFRFMDEQPGHFMLQRDGGSWGWHRLLRQLRNRSDEFWAGFDSARKKP